jgi:hypothetical protein
VFLAPFDIKPSGAALEIQLFTHFASPASGRRDRETRLLGTNFEIYKLFINMHAKLSSAIAGLVPAMMAIAAPAPQYGKLSANTLKVCN